jgi:hypothetical protein
MSTHSVENPMKNIDPASRDRFQELLAKLDTQVNHHLSEPTDQNSSHKKRSKGTYSISSAAAIPLSKDDFQTSTKQFDEEYSPTDSIKTSSKPWFEKIKRYTPALLTLGLSSACMVVVLVWSFNNSPTWSSNNSGRQIDAPQPAPARVKTDDKTALTPSLGQKVKAPATVEQPTVPPTVSATPIATATPALPAAVPLIANTSESNCSNAALALNLCSASTK